MMFYFLSISSLLALTAVAAPAHEVPYALAERQGSCPVVSQWKSYEYKTLYASTTTVTNSVSTLGSITSTKTQTWTNTMTTWETVFSPAVTSLPATTVTSYVTAPTSTFTYFIITTWVTVPGYAPSSECQVTTITNIIPSTTRITYTNDLSYATTWKSETGHVLTTTVRKQASETRTQTRPGSTTYATTATQVLTTTPLNALIPTSTITVYANGCKSWSCQSGP